MLTFRTVTPCALDLLRQLRQRAVDGVLHQSNGDVEIGADGEA